MSATGRWRGYTFFRVAQPGEDPFRAMGEVRNLDRPAAWEVQNLPGKIIVYTSI